MDLSLFDCVKDYIAGTDWSDEADVAKVGLSILSFLYTIYFGMMITTKVGKFVMRQSYALAKAGLVNAYRKVRPEKVRSPLYQNLLAKLSGKCVYQQEHNLLFAENVRVPLKGTCPVEVLMTDVYGNPVGLDVLPLLPMDEKVLIVNAVEDAIDRVIKETAKANTDWAVSLMTMSPKVTVNASGKTVPSRLLT